MRSRCSSDRCCTGLRVAPQEHAAAVEIVREHGRSSLDFFKLWPDKSYFFGPSRRAFLVVQRRGWICARARRSRGAGRCDRANRARLRADVHRKRVGLCVLSDLARLSANLRALRSVQIEAGRGRDRRPARIQPRRPGATESEEGDSQSRATGCRGSPVTNLLLATNFWRSSKACLTIGSGFRDAANGSSHWAASTAITFATVPCWWRPGATGRCRRSSTASSRTAKERAPST